MNSFRAQCLKYWAILIINARSRLQFLGALIVQALIAGLFVWIMRQLYSATFVSAQTDIINGLTLTKTVWLVMLVTCLERATWPNPIIVIDDELKSGAISYALQRPYSYMLNHLFGFFGRILPTLIGNLIVTITAAVLLVGRLSAGPKAIFAGMAACLLGYLLDFFIYFSFGLTGLWVQEVRPFTWVYSKLKLVLGGTILPIAFFPPAAQQILLMLPFANLYYSASRLIVQFDFSLFVRCIGIQMMWIIILGGCTLLMFRKGVRHVTINGG